MKQTDGSIDNYLYQVMCQIHWRTRRKASIREELLHHLEDAAADLMAEGLAPETAVRQAMEQLGNPAALGRQLNAAHRPRMRTRELLVTACCFVLVASYSLYQSGSSAAIADKPASFMAENDEFQISNDTVPATFIRKARCGSVHDSGVSS